MNSNKWVYSFGSGDAKNACDDSALLGGKGAGLARMSVLGLNVPPGFTITTEACTYFYKHKNTFPEDLEEQVLVELNRLEKILRRKFGDSQDPLLLSVRSGARVSMPGMMDTVLNLGLNDSTVDGLMQKSGNERFAYDSYRRLLQMFGDVVMKVPHSVFEAKICAIKQLHGFGSDGDLTAEHFRELVGTFKEVILEYAGIPFPTDVYEQLRLAVKAVFLSWMNKRAVKYRKMNGYPDSWGTAVNIQAMVFGNMGDKSATGVAFTRDPSNGENIFYGEYLLNAQGEDVVAGIRTPGPLNSESISTNGSPSMEEILPDAYRELLAVGKKLELHYGNMQEIEFTVEQEKLYFLQTRRGKRTVNSALRIAVEMYEEGLVSKEQALVQVDPNSLEKLLHSRVDKNFEKKVFGRGLAASPGAASGTVVFSADDAENLTAQGKDVILCRPETSPEDIHGMHSAKGILTCLGGKTSHAAVVARGIGRPCVCGLENLEINVENKTLVSSDGVVVKEGEAITLDGNEGEVLLGLVPTVQSELTDHFYKIMGWADSTKRMEVRANAETPDECHLAVTLGAEGIGLCRTEHMFFDPARLSMVRKMILAESAEERAMSLFKILPTQRQDFEKIFEITEGKPVNIRLLDMPLHEFLPKDRSEVASFAEEMDLDSKVVEKRVEKLREVNPMLGHRGCRLGISYPEIYKMQVSAILQAAAAVNERSKKFQVEPEIMIPLITGAREVAWVKALVSETAAEAALKVKCTIGTMIELPRACIRAREIGQIVDFFSFGTNDLTQTIFGLSRDDTAQILLSYQRKGILEDPFSSIDINGVGQMIQMAAERGREGNQKLRVSICGEHGADPKSIQFCDALNFDTISCSPMRLPTARLAAALSQVQLKQGDSSQK